MVPFNVAAPSIRDLLWYPLTWLPLQLVRDSLWYQRFTMVPFNLAAPSIRDSLWYPSTWLPLQLKRDMPDSKWDPLKPLADQQCWNIIAFIVWKVINSDSLLNCCCNNKVFFSFAVACIKCWTWKAENRIKLLNYFIKWVSGYQPSFIIQASSF